MLDATVVFESIRLVAVQRCVDICGLCRRNRSKESHQFLRAPEYCFWGYRCQTVCMQTQRSRAVGPSPVGNFPQIVTGVALLRRESPQFHGWPLLTSQSITGAVPVGNQRIPGPYHHGARHADPH
jgi:hypothetical protein